MIGFHSFMAELDSMYATFSLFMLQWTPILIPCLSYCEYNCTKHVRAVTFAIYWFRIGCTHPVVGLIDHMVILILYFQGISMLISTVTKLCFHQHCVRVLLSLSWSSILFFFSIIAIFAGAVHSLLMILNCISLMVSDVEHFFHISISFLWIFIWWIRPSSFLICLFVVEFSKFFICAKY